MWIAAQLKELVITYSTSGVKFAGSSSDGDLFNVDVETNINK
jgi:hypothetical protein